MQKVNMHEAKIHLSQYVDLAAAGEAILNVCE
ncbi:MAG: type II toxin-antitoxin system Phd/YefM family antitoxin [bacterium]